MKRDLYIDFVKGLATISVIFIHTVFWSGFLYVPNFIREISLLIDVPIFFLLSGLTSSMDVSRTLRKILKLQFSYMLFVFLVFIVQVVYTHKLNFNSLFSWFLHFYSPSAYPLEVAIASMWFLKIYILVLILALILLKIFSSKYYKYLILVTFLFIILLSVSFGSSLGPLTYINFYLFIFLVGYLSKVCVLSRKKIIFSFVFLLLIGLVIRFGFHILFNNVQKFPPTIVYLIYSSVSLILVLGFRGKVKIIKKNFFTYVGQNAIYYYFAQGVSSSLIYFLVRIYYTSLDWYILLPIVFFINLILAILIAEIIKKIDKCFWQLLNHIKAMFI